MVNKIIWKVILMFGGIAGAIFSIFKLPNAYEEWSYWNQHYNESHGSARSYYHEQLNEAEGPLGIAVAILVISIIVFIIGCCISVKLKQEENNQLPPLS